MSGESNKRKQDAAASPFPLTQDIYYNQLKLNDPETESWPTDPAVPDLPPLPDTDDPPPSADNWLANHATNGVWPAREAEPAPLTAPVTADSPLLVDVCWSMRSPYSYLVLERLVYLQAHYNVKLTIRPVMPIAVRSTSGGSGKAGGVFGVWYKTTDVQFDIVRTANFQDVPMPHWAVPDPIWQVTEGFGVDNWLYVFPPEKQPYIHWVTRLAAYAQLQGKGLEYIATISHLIWSGETEHWPAHVKDRFNTIEGLDYDTAIKYICDHPAEVDGAWLENSKVQTASGHGGVPLMIFRGEPFFGQDRFDEFFWRLRQNGLTERTAPLFAAKKPLRWPSDL